MYDLRAKAIARFEAGERASLLTRSNPKTSKGVKYGYLTAILHLSPADMVSKKTLCPFASEGCKAACLNTAGRGALHMMKGDAHPVQDARALRTIWLSRSKQTFLQQLKREITNFVSYSRSKGLEPCVRLNGTSDALVIRWDIIQAFPDVQFYDYTANPVRLFKDIPDNYHITFSRKEDNDLEVDRAIAAGFNVAVVFDELPETYKGVPVVDGDDSDLRFLDGPGQVVVGLKAKGDARKDNSGFVIHSASLRCDDIRLAA